MKRSREEDLVEMQSLLQVRRFHNEAGHSKSGVVNRVQEPKHDMFLSHSGCQKDFMELVYWELKRYGYDPFFDKDPYSLPEGEEFPPLIFDAVRSCPIAIFLLSEDFFTKTKWPMLELAAAVESLGDSKEKSFGKEKLLMPVLFKGLTKDIMKEKREEWKSKWEEFKRQSKPGQIDVVKWVDALDALLKRNWIAYDSAIREHGLIQSIVRSVCRSLPPPNPLSDGKVQGISSIRQAVLELIAKSPSNGVRVVGIYGIGGIGKTTLCKDLCDYMHAEFVGKVCHVELGSLPGKESKIDMLRQLHADQENSNMSTDAKIDQVLEKSVEQQKVFLALDNVWTHSQDEALFYLGLGFSPGSIVVVTARSVDVLHGLSKVRASACMEMPDLEEEDARRLFLQHAAADYEVKSEEDEKNIRVCLYRCNFSKGENKGRHFHPLALKVLGCSVQGLGRDPRLWVESLSDVNKLVRAGERVDPVFLILRRGYDLLSDEDQLLFMDVVLLELRIFSPVETKLLFKLLRSVHPNSSLKSIKMRLEGLKARALIEDIGDGARSVSVHDLYVEFAEMEARRGALDARRWIWHDREGGVPIDLWKRPSGNCWPNIERIHALYPWSYDTVHDNEEDWVEEWDGLVKGINWQHFSNVVVLVLEISSSQTLNLGGLQCLRSLTLDAVGCTLNGLGELWDLRWLDLVGVLHSPCLEEVGQLTKLEYLRLHAECKTNGSGACSQPLELLDVDNFVRLQELEVHCDCLRAYPRWLGMTSLRRVYFGDCRSATEPSRGSDPNKMSTHMSALQEIIIIKCKSICGLDGVASLKVLELCYIYELEEFPDVHQLRQLQKLCIFDFPKLLHLPNFSQLFALEELRLQNLPKVMGELPRLHRLTRLRELVLADIPKLTGVAEIGNLAALEQLGIIHMPNLAGEIPDMRPLKQLQGFYAGNTPWVETHPWLLVSRMPSRDPSAKWVFSSAGGVFHGQGLELLPNSRYLHGVPRMIEEGGDTLPNSWLTLASEEKDEYEAKLGNFTWGHCDHFDDSDDLDDCIL